MPTYTYTLQGLYERTVQLLDTPSDAGVDWGQHVLPYFAAACRDAVLSATFQSVGPWQRLIDEERFNSLLRRSGGGLYIRTHRDACLRLFLKAVSALETSRAPRKEWREVARALASRYAGPLPSGVTPQYWQPLVSYLCSSPRNRTAHVAVTYFPLALPVPIKIAPGILRPCSLMKWVLELDIESEEFIYLHPENLLSRCIGDDAFTGIFESARSAVQHLLPSKASRPGVRAFLFPCNSQHESVLRDLPLKGPSGGGALALGVYALYTKQQPCERTAISVAVNKEDGACLPVGSLEDKIVACGAFDYNRFLIPFSQQSAEFHHLAKPFNLQVSPIKDLKEGAAIMFGRRARPAVRLSRRAALYTGGALLVLGGGLAVQMRSRPNVVIYVLRTDDLSYYSQVFSFFQDKLRETANPQVIERVIETERADDPLYWQEKASDLITQFKYRFREPTKPDKTPHYIVTIGTKATKVMRKCLEDMGELGWVPWIYIGMTDPEEAGVTHLNLVNGVQYGPGVVEVARQLHQWYPERQLCFLYVNNADHYPMDSAAYKRIAAEDSLRYVTPYHLDEERISGFRPPWDPNRVICFGWYSLERLLSRGKLAALNRFGVIASTKAATWQKDLVIAAIAPSVPELGASGARILMEHLRNQRAMRGDELPVITPYHHWIKKETARKRGIPIPLEMERTADIV